MQFITVKLIYSICVLLAFPIFADSAPARASGKGGKAGTYSFRSSSGKEYNGKSIDVTRRIQQHQRSGKLNKNDLETVKIEHHNISNKGLTTIESTKIRAGDVVTNGGLENKQHAPLSRNMQKIFDTHQK